MSTAEIGSAYDLIDVEVHQKTLLNIAREMAITLLRTSGSPVVTDGKDFSTCLLDADAEQLAFSGFVTFHISTSVLGVQAVMRNATAESLRPGDAFICNDPHTSGAIHQGDVGVVVPYFYGDEHVGWGYVNEHVLDIGGSAVSGFAAEARDCYSEALRFPAVRFARRGEIDPEWERFIACNVRMPGIVLNDVRSMLAAANAGQRRLEQMLDGLGLERFTAYNAVVKQLSEEAVRHKIAALPDGVYESETWVEYDARGVEELHEVRCRLVVDGDQMTFQLRGDPQVDSFINGALPAVTGQVWTTLLSQLIYDVPVNAGVWRPIHFDLGPPGTIVNAVEPAPVSMSHMETGMQVNKLVVDVLSQACALSEDPVIAGRVAGAPVQDSALFTASGADRRTGAPIVAFPASLGMGTGGGGQTVIDGLETYGGQCTAGLSIPDVEIEEASQPGMILWRRITPDTGGAGTFRGGMGIDSAFAVLHADRLTGGAYASCTQIPPRGAAGGSPGAAGRWRVTRATNVIELLEHGALPTAERLVGVEDPVVGKTGSLVLGRGDVFTTLHGGGGGVGDPLRRDIAAVHKDVADGYVSAAHARDVYGVVLDAHGTVDPKATVARRAELRSARLGAPPEREARGDRLTPLDQAAGRWRCAWCEHDLGPTDDNWRALASYVETPATERMGAVLAYVRSRREDPQVVVRDYACPGCGSALSVDVTLHDRPPVPAARLGHVESWPRDA